MNTVKLKTNFKCSGCSAKVDEYLKKEPRIKSWEVNLNDINKTLTINYENITTDEILLLIKKAGYKASILID